MLPTLGTQAQTTTSFLQTQGADTLRGDLGAERRLRHRLQHRDGEDERGAVQAERADHRAGRGRGRHAAEHIAARARQVATQLQSRFVATTTVNLVLHGIFKLFLELILITESVNYMALVKLTFKRDWI